MIYQNNLGKITKKLKISTRDFCEFVKVHPVTFYKWRKNKMQPYKPVHISRIMALTNKKLPEIFFIKKSID